MYKTGLCNNLHLHKTTRISISCLLVMTMLSISACRNSKSTKTSDQSSEANPEPSGWYSGDIHVHRSCDGSTPIPAGELKERMAANDLAVISVLSDMGNSQAPDRVADLLKVDGKDSPLSGEGRIIHYAAEWHWDANDFEKPHQALGGHLVLLGINKAYKIWEESPYKILEWAKKQDAVCGFAHMQYLNGQIPKELNCCIPMDFPVEAALGTIDFISEDCDGGDGAINAYYKLLNCGFRIGLAAGTDYPCNGGDPFGTNLTYVFCDDGGLTYQKWIEGIKKGKTVVSRDGHNEFLDLRVNGTSIPGDEIKLEKSGPITINVMWSSVKNLTGSIELVYNGRVVATQSGTTRPGKPVVMHTKLTLDESGWLCARRMGETGHQTHTAPVFLSLKNKPFKANADDARYFVDWIDNILQNIQPGQIWSKYYTHDLDEVCGRYNKAKEVYLNLIAEGNQ